MCVRLVDHGGAIGVSRRGVGLLVHHQLLLRPSSSLLSELTRGSASHYYGDDGGTKRRGRVVPPSRSTGGDRGGQQQQPLLLSLPITHTSHTHLDAAPRRLEARTQALTLWTRAQFRGSAGLGAGRLPAPIGDDTSRGDTRVSSRQEPQQPCADDSATSGHARSRQYGHTNTIHGRRPSPRRGQQQRLLCTSQRPLQTQGRGDERRRGPLGQLTPGGGGRAPRLAEVNLVRHGSSNHPVGINVESARQGSQQREEELHGTLVIIVEDLRTSTAPSSVETRTSRDACAVQQPPKRALRGSGTAPSSVETHTSWDACAVWQPPKWALRGAEDWHRAWQRRNTYVMGTRVPSSNLKSGPSEEQGTSTAPSSVETHTSWDACAVQQPQKQGPQRAEYRHCALAASKAHTSWERVPSSNPLKAGPQRSRGPAPRLAASKRIRHGTRVPSRQPPQRVVFFIASPMNE
ncbi:hypothetical protein O3P69_008185 [Scylla paramamosain]|uniref:Uncharacterized protein n=1 Tax=Scylla paramamosain TaxID=85552 RepID=A0AAW0T149_SCYPA